MRLISGLISSLFLIPLLATSSSGQASIKIEASNTSVIVYIDVGSSDTTNQPLGGIPVVLTSLSPSNESCESSDVAAQHVDKDQGTLSPLTDTAPQPISNAAAAGSLWSYQGNVFGNTVTITNYAPALVNHNGELFVMYLDQSSTVYYAKGDNDFFGDPIKFVDSSNTALTNPTAFALASFYDTLHAVTQDDGYDITHFVFNDTTHVWTKNTVIVTDYEYPALAVFNGQLFLTMMSHSGNKLVYATWDPVNGWSAILSANSESTWGSPAMFEQYGALNMMFSTNDDDRDLINLVWNSTTKFWSRVAGPPEHTAFGVSATFSEDIAFAVFQENNSNDGTILVSLKDDGSWIPRHESAAGQRSSDTPAVAVLDGIVNVVFNSRESSPKLLRAQRTILPYSPTSWMSGVSDSLPISGLSIPGTHDSVAISSVPSVGTQTMSITDQLNAGIRYFDLRCRLIGNNLYMYHGFYPLSISMDTVVGEIQAWLKIRPTEAVIVQIKQEQNPYKPTTTFATAVLNLINQAPSSWSTNTALPNLGSIRGKMQLVRRYDVNTSSGEQAIGIDVTSWENNSPQFNITTPSGVRITVQDLYEFDDALEVLVQKKYSAVKAIISQSLVSPDPYMWFINFASATHTLDLDYVSPEDIALGGMDRGRFAAGVNTNLRALMNSFPQEPFFRARGTILMDFPEGPDEDLIALIIGENWRFVISDSQ